MKINMVKLHGGGLIASTDIDTDKMRRFENGGTYEIDIKLSRNPKFLSKMMVFFHYCFSHWDGWEAHEHCTEKEQFERMRKDLTILAGFYVQTVRLDGSFRVEAKSLAFDNMDEDEFSECYHAVVQASIKHIFHNADEKIINNLYNFF